MLEFHKGVAETNNHSISKMLNAMQSHNQT